MGWDKYREIVHQRQLDMGIIPPGTELSPHDPDVPVWDTLSADAQRLYSRMMEVYAGFMSYHRLPLWAHPRIPARDRRAG
jgi:arylsulfatase A-like enzyme